MGGRVVIIGDVGAEWGSWLREVWKPLRGGLEERVFPAEEPECTKARGGPGRIQGH